MKIQLNKNNAKSAWLMSVNALDVIKNMFLDNVWNDEAEEAYWTILHHLNNWYDEIEKMPH